ncbi:MAG: replication-associated recombination protein A [Nitrospirae bacterium]|nr:replication-associated recombination protein A [Nitrospirota bacterium]MBI3351619.1 replication-associated recombination protein A [Nitrospirota bacterium]
MDLFSQSGQQNPDRPLADRMRPKAFEEFFGQEHLIGPGKILSPEALKNHPPSLVLWGPPGSGKTTLAHLIAHMTGCFYVFFSAVLSGVKEVREIVAEAKFRFQSSGQKTLLFVDEIHRFNRSQQDAFLPHLEDGTLILLGATTENPSFSVNAPLLSRCKVLALKPLELHQVTAILQRAIDDPGQGLGKMTLKIDDPVLREIAEWAEGDARRALNLLEACVNLAPELHDQKVVTDKEVREAAQSRILFYDKQSEEHYNTISAFIKSMRGSDPDASVYWLARMLEAGEDPLFIARRMIVFASEDIGNADPNALPIAVAAQQAFQAVGLAEGWIPLSQAVTYMATAPKSNASYMAYKNALEAVKKRGSLPVPLHLRNAPTSLMKELGYGEGYQYPHSEPVKAKEQTYLPDKLLHERFYLPKDSGYEKQIKEWMSKGKKDKEK